MKNKTKYLLLLLAALLFVPASSGCTIAEAINNRQAGGGEIVVPEDTPTDPGQEAREIIYVLGITGMD